MEEAIFHPLVQRWFNETFAAPTEIQRRGWQSIAAGVDTLIAAPTGSGKTLAAFLWAVNRLVEAAATGVLEDRTYVIYVSPLKALGNDIEKNLRAPLAAIQHLADASGVLLPAIRVAVRSGDTPASERQMHLKRPPHILITTPESLFILLTAEKSRGILRRAETIIVDEIHAVAADKRGAHLALSLERLDALATGPLQRIGLSATQKPIDEVARLLVGTGRCDGEGRARCEVIDAGHRRELDLRVETTDMELGPIASQEQRAEIYDRLVELIREHRTTIVFVNTRRLVERVSHALGERLGDDKVAAHHGSLSRETRLAAEQGLKSGAVPVVVATASLELGIDVGHVDLVCHLGAPRSLASLLQRTGRSGHFLGAVPKGIIFPLTRDDLVQAAAAVRAVYRGELDRLRIFENALDILAQQMVAIAASGEIGVEELWNLVRRSYPFRNLRRRDYDDVLEMLAEGVSTRRGRRSAHLHLDRVHGRVRARRGARLAAITSGGAIPDTADYDVVEHATNAFVGKVNEDFAIESMAGDVFLLGNRSWRIARVEAGRMRVIDADGAAPTIPFWVGEAPARTEELSRAVADLRREVAARHRQPLEALDWLVRETHVDGAGAEQIVRYIAETMASLGGVPTEEHLIAERFFDEAGGMQLVLHTPLGGRINRALGLALRKRFCVSFDFELQAAATDDGVVLSLGEQHSFPLDSVFSMLRAHRVDEDLTQAALVSPMFTNRWRWNATRALALLRHSGGRRVPMPIQRMRAEDLLAAVFPAQVACGDNHPGPVEPVDHPLVNETLDNCLHEAMDAEGLKRILGDVESGRIRVSAVETPAPSPMSHEILNANPYAFLDDAPLEERRSRAVSLRRVDPDIASGIGALDPEAIAEVRRQAWPEARDADEVHDALLSLGLLPENQAAQWGDFLADLVHRGRAVRIAVSSTFVATERTALVRLALGNVAFVPEPPPLQHAAASPVGEDPDAAVAEIVRGWMDVVGPITSADLVRRLGIAADRVEAALLRLESLGSVLRGRFSAGDASETEWCERGLLARIHRMTLGRLRREIEAVSAADFMRFLMRWQCVAPGTQLHGRDGIRKVIGQLQGLEVPGPAWEQSLLPSRIAVYEPADLEQLCLAGEIAWGRLGVSLAPEGEAEVERAPQTGDARPATAGRSGSPPEEAPFTPTRRRSAPTRSAPLAFVLRESLPDLLVPQSEGREWLAQLSPIAGEVYAELERRGASFLADIARSLRRLPTEVEDALWELVACGVVTGDGIAGLRTLLLPEDKRQARSRHLRMLPGGGSRRLMPVGRWSLLRAEGDAEIDEQKAVEAAARRLLQRWGVVFRELLAREKRLPRWRRLLYALRRMEARGEVRGGRFVAGFVGEQFALPDAVEALRAVRRRKDTDGAVLVAAADPLNLVGIVTPGVRVSPFSGQVIAYVEGLPAEVGDLGAVLSRLQKHAVP